MKALRHLLLCAIGGAFVSIGVAWVCAAFVPIGSGTKVFWTNFTVRQNSEYPPWLVVTRWDRVGAQRIAAELVPMSDDSARGATLSVDELVPRWGASTLRIRKESEPHTIDEESWRWGHVSRNADARGWPLLALWGGAWLQSVSSSNDISSTTLPPLIPRFECAIPLDATTTVRSNPCDIRWLPLAPIWPGFAINTLFYAAIMWLLFAAPFALRRWRRIKRGLCPACAYPVGGSDVCTECGKPLPKRAGTAL